MSKDRRVTKSQKAIYQAFIALLNDKGYQAMTVQDIIARADVGRTTFYAHFSSKEALLERYCQELFHHFQLADAGNFDAYLAHLFQHFHQNQDQVARLLTAGNPYFDQALTHEITKHIYPEVAARVFGEESRLPQTLQEHRVALTFTGLLSWWLSQRHKVSEEELVTYFWDMLR